MYWGRSPAGRFLSPAKESNQPEARTSRFHHQSPRQKTPSHLAEKRDRHGAGAGVRTDHAGNQCFIERIRPVLPQGAAVVDILAQKRVAQPRIAQQNRQLEVNPTAGMDLLHE